MKQINPKTIKQGDVLLVDFPYNDKIGSKRRPAVVSRVKDNSYFYCQNYISNKKSS